MIQCGRNTPYMGVLFSCIRKERCTTPAAVISRAYAATGHAAAPPSVAKNFRRPMWLAM
jgi:hypothetical protein